MSRTETKGMDMRKFSFEAAWACLLFLLLSFVGSCDRFASESDNAVGVLCVSFDESVAAHTRASPEIPDTSDFLLTISGPSGVLYDGLFGDCPESLELQSGSYTVRVVSRIFDRPAFDAPQYGDEQCVVVPAGGVVSVRLECEQINSGVRLDVSDDFLTECPESVLFLKSASGKLMYSYSEKRYAYFHPGEVSLVMNENDRESVLMNVDLEAREMLSLKVSVAKSSKSDKSCIEMTVDTTRKWRYDEYVIGGQSSNVESETFTVAQAMRNVGAEDVWVSGYIVGGDLTSASASFETPFKSKSNVLLGPRSSTSERDACLSVQLPDGKVREALNLVDNPHLLKKKVKIKGDIVEPYFGMPGIKNTIDYQLF